MRVKAGGRRQRCEARRGVSPAGARVRRALRAVRAPQELAPRALFGGHDGSNDVFYASELGPWAAQGAGGGDGDADGAGEGAGPPAGGALSPDGGGALSPGGGSGGGHGDAAAETAARAAARGAEQARRSSPLLIAEMLRGRVPAPALIGRALPAAPTPAPAAKAAATRGAGDSDRRATAAAVPCSAAAATPEDSGGGHGGGGGGGGGGDGGVAGDPGDAGAQLVAAVLAALESPPLGLVSGGDSGCGDPWSALSVAADDSSGGHADDGAPVLVARLEGGPARPAARGEVARARGKWEELERALGELARGTGRCGRRDGGAALFTCCSRARCLCVWLGGGGAGERRTRVACATRRCRRCR